MTDREFENYLAVLSRLLRLRGSQQQVIADELRDHFEDRLDDLLDQGMTRTEAVSEALREFGDAAGLAADFSEVFRNRKRRWMMRISVSAVAASLLAVVATWSFWPAHEPGVFMRPLIAQEPAVAKPPATSDTFKKIRDEAATPDLAGAGEGTVERALRKPSTFDFIETPLPDVIAFVEDLHDVQVSVDEAALTKGGVEIESPVTMQLRGISLGSCLNLLLRPLDLTYTVEGDVLVITTIDAAIASLETRVHPVWDIVRQKNEEGSWTGDYDTLIELITATVDPASWDEVGGPASVDAHKGLLIVSQTRTADIQIQKMLSTLRTVPRIDEEAEYPFQAGDAVFVNIQRHDKVRVALEKPCRIDVVDTPLDEVIAFIADVHKIPIHIDVHSLSDVGVDENVPVSCTLREVPLRQALKWILSQVNLTYSIQNEVLLITSPESAEENLLTALYPVADIIDLNDTSLPAVDDELTAIGELITTAVQPVSWDEVGGSGSVGTFPSRALLVVSQTFDTQRLISDMLVKLRKARNAKHAAPVAQKPDPKRKTTQIYNVPHMEMEQADLDELIRRFVEPKSWEEDQEVYIKVLPKLVVVHHTDAAHRQLKQLMIKLGLTTPTGGLFGGGGGMGGQALEGAGGFGGGFGGGGGLSGGGFGGGGVGGGGVGGGGVGGGGVGGGGVGN